MNSIAFGNSNTYTNQFNNYQTFQNKGVLKNQEDFKNENFIK